MLLDLLKDNDMIKSFFFGEDWLYAWLMLTLILAITWYTVEILVFYNTWNKEFFDTIQELNEPQFWYLLKSFDMSRIWELITLQKVLLEVNGAWLWVPKNTPSFIEIVGLYVPISTYLIWQTQRYTFRWREANTKWYLQRWDNCTATIEGGSQRIQEDLMLFGKILQGLFTGFFSAIVVLIAFLPILWRLSENLPIWNGEVIPGFLVWVALIVSGGGTLISLLLGWPLPGLEYNNQAVEATFRKKLVYSEDDFSHRAVVALFPMFAAIKKNYYRLFNWYMAFSVWQTAFGFLVGNIAIVVLAPAYFSEIITLGVLFQVVNAFGRVEGSMSYFIDRWPVIVEFMSVIKRLREFDAALTEAEKK